MPRAVSERAWEWGGWPCLGESPRGCLVCALFHRPNARGAPYFAWMYPSFVSNSAVSTAPPAAPRTVLWLSATKR